MTPEQKRKKRIYYRANRDRILAYNKKYDRVNKVTKLEKAKTWYDQNRIKKLAYLKEYRKRKELERRQNDKRHGEINIRNTH